MLQGTGSDVGKSVLVAGLCRAARLRGINVRPFKPQNMSNNAAVVDLAGERGGGEIGRAQWLQAVACGVEPSVHMNPVLIKPHSDTGAQIVLRGEVHGRTEAASFPARMSSLIDVVLESWAQVKSGADLVIVEGAGSPAEVNLRRHDIANMGFATRANVPVIMIGDIDRGGVIAALVGTHQVLAPADRRMIRGYLINKFRGDLSLFEGGIEAIERHTGWPCFGVVPWLREAAWLPSEDSVALERTAGRGSGRLKVAVPLLSRIANFDDLDPLRMEQGVEVVFVPPGRPLPSDAHLVVIPGTKATIADLAFFRANGWERDLQAHRGRGGHVVGLCGGYQMLGRKVRDPHGLEGAAGQAEGLGLLDVETVMEAEKKLRNVTAHSTRFDTPVAGYEIHMGRTSGPDCARPALLIDGVGDGAMSGDGKVVGTYVHGLFSLATFRARFLESLGAASSGGDGHDQIERALDVIARRLEDHLDVEALLAAAG